MDADASEATSAEASGWKPEDGLRWAMGSPDAIVDTKRDNGPAGLPAAAVVEIFEYGRATDDTAPGSVVVPDAIRVNGMELLVDVGGIKIKPLGDCEPLMVTLTLFARRVTIGAERDLHPQS